MKIFVFSPYLPAIDTSACARKIYDCVSLLHQRGHFIYLLSFCSEQDRERINAIRPYCVQLHLEYIGNYSRYPYNSHSLRRKVELLCRNENIAILQCEKAHMSQYVPKGIKVASILIEHEVLSASFLERVKLENNFIKKLILLARKTKKLLEEKKWYRKFDRIIALSEYDKDTIRNLYDIETIEVIPLGINLKDYPLHEAKEKLYDLIFVGNFSHFPNVDAVLHFYRNILPLIKNKLPNISVVIVGMNPYSDMKKLAKLDKNITVTGYVKDVLGHYSKSKVFIAPIRYGTGMRYKILEAMASRVPIVTTSVGARGIIFKENIKIADTPREFAEKVIELLNNSAEYEDLAEKGRLTVERYYNWDILLNKYENIYYSLLEKDMEKIA